MRKDGGHLDSLIVTKNQLSIAIPQKSSEVNGV